MITREIVDAYRYVTDDDTEWWMITTRNPDSSPYVYALPAVTFENLAVEYGLDDSDIDALLRIAILQLHIPDSSARRNFDADPAAKKGFVRGGKPVTLGNADSTAHARDAHLERINWVEQHLVAIVDPVPGQKRKTRALDLDHDKDSEVDPHQRLTALKASYRPDRRNMQATRDKLKAVLGRDV